MLTRDTSYRKTFDLGTTNLAIVKGYDPLTGILTSDPGDTIRFQVSRDFIDNSGRDLRQGVFFAEADQTCLDFNRTISAPETFWLAATASIYDKVAVVSVQDAECTLCYVNLWVNPKFCPPIFPDQSCSYPCPECSSRC